MRQYPALIPILLIAVVATLCGGCSLLPLIDPHGHSHSDDDDHEAEPPKPSDDELDPDLMLLPPPARERVKALTIDELIELLRGSTIDEIADGATAAPYHYRRAAPEDKRRIEETIVALTDRADEPAMRQRAAVLLLGLENSYFETRQRLAMSDPDHQVRLTAIDGLAGDGMQAAAALRELTNDPDSQIRKTAQDVLSRVLAGGDDAAIRALVQDLGVYENDASALAATAIVPKGAEALPALSEAALNDPNPHRRAAATTCIAMICAGDNEMIDDFAKMAKATRHSDRARVESNPTGLPVLIRVLETDTFAPSREIAAQGLGYLGSAQAAGPLAKALSDPDPYVRRRAAAAFETVPGETAVGDLARVAVRDADPDVRRFAVKALGRIGTPDAVRALANATRDGEAKVRQAAADELGRLAAVESLEALGALINDPVDDVRWAAARAIGELREKDAVPHLMAALRDSYPPVSNAAERGLQKLGIAQRKAVGFREPERGRPDIEDERHYGPHGQSR